MGLLKSVVKKVALTAAVIVGKRIANRLLVKVAGKPPATLPGSK